MLHAKLSSKFQLFIPKAMLDLKAGQEFTLLALARGRIIELIPQRSVKEARGMLSGGTDSSEYRGYFSACLWGIWWGMKGAAGSSFLPNASYFQGK